MRTLVVTNDFPTRRGGIETFVLSLCERMDPGEVVVHTARMPGDREFDASLPFPVRRDPTRVLLPTPAVADRVARTLREEGCDRVVFGAAAPLGLLAPRLRREGAERIVGLTHGHEVWWARTPGTRAALRRIGAGCDTLTYVSDWCREQIAPALAPRDAAGMRRLSPGVDAERFRPGCGGDDVRRRWGIAPQAPVVVCTARLVARKGQDVLLRAWPGVRREYPDAVLLIVGDGPDRRRLRRAAGDVAGVVLTGSVPWSEVPAHTDAGDVFAMPCRTRLGGLEPEAFGIVFLEAAACGLPVIAGDSGGAGETVLDGVTGAVVDGRDVEAVGRSLTRLLGDPELRRRQGLAGRARVEREWTWERSAGILRALLT